MIVISQFTSGRLISKKMPQDELETLEAALNFISQYELSSAGTPDAVDLTLAFEHSHKLNKSHSLEVPEQRHAHAFTHSHSLEIPEEDTDAAAFDTGFHAAEELLDEIKGENELFDATTDSGMQDAISLSVRPSLPTQSLIKVTKRLLALQHRHLDVATVCRRRRRSASCATRWRSSRAA